MKLNKSLFSAAVIAGSLLAGQASANISASDFSKALRTVTGPAKVSVTVKDGVATLFGHVDSQFERLQAASAVEKIDGIDQVRNLLTY